MATYNGAQYLREQIDSILNQTYPVHELIIQDDKSTDNTVAIANEYANRNSVVKVFVNERNTDIRQDIANRFSPVAIAQKYCSLYNDLLKNQ